MLDTIFATKLTMSQGWTKAGRRVAMTRCRVDNNIVIAQHNLKDEAYQIFEIGSGNKKLKNMTKPLASKIKKSGFLNGVLKMRGVRVAPDELKVGEDIKVERVLTEGDVVDVQGTSKGRGFAGAVKRHGFHGGARTHGQSDRMRAVGSIGAGTTPGRVLKGKRMPGHFGTDTITIKGLVVLHVDPQTQELWLSGPVPGSFNSLLTIYKTNGQKKIELNKKASGIREELRIENEELKKQDQISETK